MHTYLIEYINNLADTPLTKAEIDLVKEKHIPKKLRKRQYFLQQGEVCKYMAFIVKGAMRQYRIDDRGTEHIVFLGVEHWWVSDRDSFMMLTPSIYNIDAWEDTDMLLVSKSDMLLLQRSVPAIGQAIAKLDQYHYIAMQNRVNSLISMSAEERYHNFLRTYPFFHQRFPQHQIASYLGISRETLSRIKKTQAFFTEKPLSVNDLGYK